MKNDPRVPMVAEINVTPMIDVMLVLLVIFMLGLQLRAVLPLNVPAPRTTERPTSTAHLVVELKADGSYALNDSPIDLPRLGDRVTELYAGGQRGVLFVRAAPHRRYKDVVEVIDIARGAGVAVVGYMP